eukprot:scaffold1239_cov319-Prasinococcus_capsulatus_cf.AAC.4
MDARGSRARARDREQLFVGGQRSSRRLPGELSRERVLQYDRKGSSGSFARGRRRTTTDLRNKQTLRQRRSRREGELRSFQEFPGNGGSVTGIVAVPE